MMPNDDYADRDEARARVPWRALLESALRRRGLVLAVFSAGLGLSLLSILLAEPVYRATATLMVTSERARITVSPDPKEGSRVEPVTDQDLNAEVALLRSQALMRTVLEGYRTRLDPPPRTILAAAADGLRGLGQLPARLYRSLHAVGEPDPLEEWVRRTGAATTVVAVRGSNLIEATFEASRPRWAAEFLNTLVDAHVANHAVLHQQAAAQQFLGTQRELLQTRLADADTTLQGFYAREGIDSIPQQGPASARTRQADLETVLADTDRELAEATARAGFLADAIQTHPRGVAADAASGRSSPGQMVQARLVELELERSTLLTEYAPGSIRVRDIDRQLAHAKKLAAAQASSDAATVNPSYLGLSTELTQTGAQQAALAARAEALRGQIAAGRERLAHLDGIASEHERLQQEVASAKEAYLTYLKKEEEARFSAALDDSPILNVAVVQRATAPTVPQASKAGLTLLLGALVSLLAALAVAIVRDQLDPSVKSAAEAGRVAGLPVLLDMPS